MNNRLRFISNSFSLRNIFLLVAELVLLNMGPLHAQELASNLLSEKQLNEVAGSDQLVSVNFFGEPLPIALHLIAEQVDAGLSYRTDLIPKKSVTYKAVQQPVYKVL